MIKAQKQSKKSKRRLSQLGTQMLKDAEAVVARSPSPTKMLERKRSDLDREMVTNRSRSTSGAVIKKLRARPNERRSSTDISDVVGMLPDKELELDLEGLGAQVRRFLSFP